MGWWLFPCEKPDPLLSLLRDTFSAHPIRVPEERYQPLGAIAVAGRKAHWRGNIQGLLSGKPDLQAALDVSEGAMPTLTARKTNSVEIDLGVKVLDGFLQAFNVQSAGCAAAFRGAQTAAFSFGNVRRLYIDLPSLGQLLKRHRLDRSNPLNGRFIKGEHQLHVIESVIISNEFTIFAETSQGSEFKIDVPLIQDLLLQAHADVTLHAASSKMISFTGVKPLAFAFTCSRFFLDEEARIWTLDPSEMELILGEEAEAKQQKRRLLHSAPRVLLEEEPGLFYFDEDTA